MEQYVIKGGNPLVGEVEIGGAKNAALGILVLVCRYTNISTCYFHVCNICSHINHPFCKIYANCTGATLKMGIKNTPTCKSGVQNDIIWLVQGGIIS